MTLYTQRQMLTLSSLRLRLFDVQVAANYMTLASSTQFLLNTRKNLKIFHYIVVIMLTQGNNNKVDTLFLIWRDMIYMLAGLFICNILVLPRNWKWHLKNAIWYQGLLEGTLGPPEMKLSGSLKNLACGFLLLNIDHKYW